MCLEKQQSRRTLETLSPSASMCWAEAEAQGQEERRPQTYCKFTVFGGEQTSWPKTSNKRWPGQIKWSFNMSSWHPRGIQSYQTGLKAGSLSHACFHRVWEELLFRSTPFEKNAFLLCSTGPCSQMLYSARSSRQNLCFPGAGLPFKGN